jgi:hypothetical protein
VTRAIDAIESEPHEVDGFRALCGVIPKSGAMAMNEAIAECARVDRGEW